MQRIRNQRNCFLNLQRSKKRRSYRLKKKDLRIGIQILFSGLWPKDWSPEYDEAKESFPWPESENGYIRIKRKDFEKYITDDLYEYIQMWHRICSYGWPQGKGYLAEPESVRVIVELFDQEKANFLAWEKQKQWHRNSLKN